MGRENDGDALRDLGDGLERALQLISVIHVGGAMEGEHDVGSGRQSQLRAQRRGPGNLESPHQRIDHEIADEKDLVWCDSFVGEIPVGAFLGGEKKV